MLDGILGFFDERVFGPRRKELLEQDLRYLDGEPERKRQRQLKSLRRAIEKLELAQARLIRRLEADEDPDGILFRRVRERLSELEQERLQKVAELQDFEAEDPEIEPGAIELIDELPVGEGIFGTAPDNVLRDLFQTFRLEVRFDKPSHLVNCRVTIDDDSVSAIAENIGERSVFPGWCTDVGRECPRQDSNLRTTLRRRVLYPLSYGGPSGHIISPY